MSLRAVSEVVNALRGMLPDKRDLSTDRATRAWSAFSKYDRGSWRLALLFRAAKTAFSLRLSACS